MSDRPEQKSDGAAFAASYPTIAVDVRRSTTGLSPSPLPRFQSNGSVLSPASASSYTPLASPRELSDGRTGSQISLLPHPVSHPLAQHPLRTSQAYHTFSPPLVHSSSSSSFSSLASLHSSPEPASPGDGASTTDNDSVSSDLSSATSDDPTDDPGAVLAEVETEGEDEREKAASAQAAAAVDELYEEGNEARSDPTKRPPFSWKKFWRFSGPGWLMSIAYLDPGNLESDLQSGALTGYQLLWVLLLATLLGYFLQVLSVRLGVVTGKHLAQVCRQEYGRRLRLMVWVMIELAVIGSDIQEVLGSALALKILFGLPLWAGVLITAADTFTFLFLHAFGVRKLEAFFAALITCMCVCFFIDFGYSVPDGGAIARGFLPTVQSYAILQAVGLIGSIVMPHNMYLHSALVQSRQVNRRSVARVKEACFYFSLEAAVALAVSFAINFAVVCVFARGFFDEQCAQQGMGLVDGQCVDTIGLGTAGDVLKGLLGSSAQVVWAIGLLASGQSSTMTGVTTGQYVMSGFVAISLKPWQRIILTRSIALVPSVSVALASLGDESRLDATTQAVNVVMSVLIPFAILPLLHFTSQPRLMGGAVNSAWMKCVGWGFAALVLGINIYLVVVTLQGAGVSGGAWVGFGAAALLYVCMVSLLVQDEAAAVARWLRGAPPRLRDWWAARGRSAAAPTGSGAREMEDRRQVGLVAVEAAGKGSEVDARVQDEKVAEVDVDLDGTLVSGSRSALMMSVDLTTSATSG